MFLRWKIQSISVVVFGFMTINRLDANGHMSLVFLVNKLPESKVGRYLEDERWSCVVVNKRYFVAMNGRILVICSSAKLCYGEW